MNWTHTIKPIWPTTYAKSPPIPKWFSDGITSVGGLNPRGEPNYRVVWGMDVRDFCNGDPRAPKYMNPNNTSIGWACFMLERWVPAEFFDRSEWENVRRTVQPDGKFIDHIGEYKNQGSYILTKELMTDDYVPLQLTSGLLEVLQWGIQQGPLSGQELRDHNTLQRKVKQAKDRERIDKLLLEQREFYQANAEKINARASRHTVTGLMVPEAEKLKNFSKILLPTQVGTTGKEQHVN